MKSGSSAIFYLLAAVVCMSIAPLSFASWHHLPVGQPKIRCIVTDSTGTRLLCGIFNSGLWYSDDGGYTLSPINERVMPDIKMSFDDLQCLDADCDTIFSRVWATDTLPRVWFSFNGGDNWDHIPDAFSDYYYNIYIDVWRINPAVWFLASVEHFRRSTDYNEGWIEYGLNLTTRSGVFQDPFLDSTVYNTGDYTYVSSNDPIGGFLRSDDLGVTWTNILDLYSEFGISWAEIKQGIRLSNGDYLCLVPYTDNFEWLSQSRIARSTDEGSSWTIVNGGLPSGLDPIKIIEDKGMSGNLFLIARNRVLYRSRDYGITWESCRDLFPDVRMMPMDLTQNTFNHDIYLSLNGNGVFRSHDHGENWERVSLSNFGSLGRPSITEEAIFYTDQSNYTWRLDHPYSVWDTLGIPSVEDTLFLIDQVIHQSGDTLVCKIYKLSQIGSYLSTHIGYSYDDGLTWEFSEEFTFLRERYVQSHVTDSVIRFITYSSHYVYVSTDLGRHWRRSSTPEDYSVVECTQNDGSLFIAACLIHTYDYFIFTSSNEGESWESMNYTGPPLSSRTEIMTVPFSDELFVTSGTNLMHWDNGVWETRGSIPNPDSMPLNSMHYAFCQTPLLVGNYDYSNRLVISDDGGYTWQVRDDSLPYDSQNYSLWHLVFDPWRQRFWAGSSLGPVYIEVDDLGIIRRGTGSSDNQFFISTYPDPTNAVFTIKYTINKPGKYDLILYNVLGRRVLDIFRHTYLSSGTHEREADISTLSSGTYFLSLSSSQSRKTTPVKVVR